MARQRKRTLRKYNKSRKNNATPRKRTYRKKNNTRKRTRRRKSRTHNRMRGGTGTLRESLLGGTPKKEKQTLQGRAATAAGTLQRGIGSLTSRSKDQPSLETGFVQAPSGLPVAAQPAAAQLAAQPVAAQPAAALPVAAQPAAQLSNKKDFLKHAASGLGGAAVALNPQLALAAGLGAGATVAAAGAGYGAYKVGKGIKNVAGSLYDSSKYKLLFEGITKCLKKLVAYAVIDENAVAVILERLKKNIPKVEGGVTVRSGTRAGQKAQKKQIQGEVSQQLASNEGLLQLSNPTTEPSTPLLGSASATPPATDWLRNPGTIPQSASGGSTSGLDLLSLSGGPAGSTFTPAFGSLLK